MAVPRRPLRHPLLRELRSDRGAFDASLGMIFGAVAVMTFVLLLFEAVAHWHAHNVIQEAAAEGARVAAAFDGTCALGRQAAQASIESRASGWSNDVSVVCSEAAGVLTVTVTAGTPGFIAGGVGFRLGVTQSAPRER